MGTQGRTVTAVPARYAGFCPVCDEPIESGEHITREPSGQRWVHADCAYPQSANTTTVCRCCNMVGRLSERGYCPDCEAER